jgi:hypothetical protein
MRRIQSDADGRFQTGAFIDPNWREFTVVVHADGFAAFTQTLLVSPDIPQQSIRLSPRKPLNGIVVDSQGRRIEGAVVQSATEFGFAGLDWKAESGPDGRFVWYDAPVVGRYLLNVRKPPFRQVVARMVAGGTDEITIALHRLQRMHGTVTDGQTGRPIERFDLILGSGPHHPGWAPEWLRRSIYSFNGGKFDLTGPDFEQDMYHSIRIEADGYEPDEFIRFHDSLEDVAHDFNLRKAAILAGVVRGRDGRPLAGVDVALSGPDYDTPFENGRLKPGSTRSGAPMVRTGRDGRYVFRPQAHRDPVMAVHDTGFAIRFADELAATGDLTLAPWGRVEGMVKIGNKPAAGRRVGGWLFLPVPMVRYATVTDDSGRFVLDRVAPGRITVYYRVDNADHQGWTLSNSVSVDVKPGETARIQVGGTGRPIVGRLAVPEGASLDHFTLGHGVLAFPTRELPTPADFPEFDSKKRLAWWSAFYRTADGRSYAENRDLGYAVDLRQDGTFRIEDVPEGRYELKLPFEGLSRGTREGRQAFARCEVIVPEIPGGSSEEPLDIGTIPLEVFVFHEPKVGDRVPSIAAKAPDGRRLDLAALQGKFVLLHFWSGRPEDAATVPDLKAVYAAFGRDERFIMIGLHSDETPGAVARYAALRGLSWEQRYIGSGYDPNPFEAAFGVWFPPAAFLIGPDGRILAKDLEGGPMQQAVAKALKSGN